MNTSSDSDSISDSDSDVTYPQLAKLLCSLELEEYFNEIIDKVLYPLHDRCLSYDNHDQCIDIVSTWSVNKLCSFIRSCSFLSREIASNFSKEFVDGICFLNLIESDCYALKLDGKAYTLICIIRDGWRFSLGECFSYNKSKPAFVQMGLMADLSSLSSDLAKRLDDADRDAVDKGKGKIYGQLLCLGYKEYKYVGDDGYLPVGINNEKFLLQRRKIPNGIKILESIPDQTSMLSQYTMEGYNGNKRFIVNYVPDPTKDIFQIGRSEDANDFVIRGYCHEERHSSRGYNGTYTGATSRFAGPTSRFACRIISSRLPPFNSFLYASGFSEKKVMSLTDNKHIISCSKNDEFDVLTAFGVKLWHPDLKKWGEVSVNGNVYNIRKNIDEPGGEMNDSSFTNELLDGSIIDLCGVSIIFQKSPSTSKLDPITIVKEINALQIQCPVLLHSIEFQYLNPRQRAVRAIKNLIESEVGYHIPGSLHIPAVDYSDIEEQHRSFVFPSCGHVHGFHNMLVGKACTLCRRTGEFVPLAFDFQASLDANSPTHVFNPCGHVASEICCSYWSKIPQPIYEGKTKAERMSAKCPYCSTELIASNPFNKLVLQTESGKEWCDVAAEIEIEEVGRDKDDNPDQVPIQHNSCQSYLKQYPKFAPQLGIIGY